MPPKQVKHLQHYFDHKNGRSKRKAGRKFDIWASYVIYLLKTKSTIKCRKKQKNPNRSDRQAREERPSGR